MKWTTEGFKFYEQFLQTLPFDNKENVPPQQM